MSESSVEIIARLEAKLLEKTERVVALEARLDRAIEELKKIRQVISIVTKFSWILLQ